MSEISDRSLSYDREFLRELMVRMMTVNRFEERIHELFGQGLVHGTMHLCIGEEATGVGTGAALKKDDYMLATHRGHGHALGRGEPITARAVPCISVILIMEYWEPTALWEPTGPSPAGLL